MSYYIKMAFAPGLDYAAAFRQCATFADEYASSMDKLKAHLREVLPRVPSLRQEMLQPGTSSRMATDFRDFPSEWDLEWSVNSFVLQFTYWPSLQLLGIVVPDELGDEDLKAPFRGCVIFQDGTDQDYEWDTWKAIGADSDAFLQHLLKDKQNLSMESASQVLGFPLDQAERWTTDQDYYRRWAMYRSVERLLNIQRRVLGTPYESGNQNALTAWCMPLSPVQSQNERLNVRIALRSVLEEALGGV